MTLNEVKNITLLVCAWLGGVASYAFGGIDGILITLIAFTIFDYVTGILSAIINGKLSSYKGYKGIIKKIALYILVAISVLLERFIGIPAIREIVIMFFIGNEGISILENMVEIGVDVPPAIKTALNEINKKGSE